MIPIAGKVLGGASDKGGVNTDLQLGDRANEGQLGEAVQKGTGDIKAEDKSQVTVNNTQDSTDAKIENAQNVTVQNIPPWVVLVLLLGWILPTPSSIWKNIRGRCKKGIRGRYIKG